MGNFVTLGVSGVRFLWVPTVKESLKTAYAHFTLPVASTFHNLFGMEAKQRHGGDQPMFSSCLVLGRSIQSIHNLQAGPLPPPAVWPSTSTYQSGT